MLFRSRIEHLVKLFHAKSQSADSWQSRDAMSALLKIVNIVDRPDLKPKLTQALSQHASALAALETVPQVQTDKLTSILEELDSAVDALHSWHGKFGDNLRQNEFLNHIRMHISNPAGACDYATPEYVLWLKSSPEQRHFQLQEWFSEFKLLIDVVNLHLRITRTSTPFQRLEAEKGFFQQTLDSSNPALLLRIRVNANDSCYPENSVGKHRIIIRFLQLADFCTGQTQQVGHNMQIGRASCRERV